MERSRPVGVQQTPLIAEYAPVLLVPWRVSRRRQSPNPTGGGACFSPLEDRARESKTLERARAARGVDWGSASSQNSNSESMLLPVGFQHVLIDVRRIAQRGIVTGSIPSAALAALAAVRGHGVR